MKGRTGEKNREEKGRKGEREKGRKGEVMMTSQCVEAVTASSLGGGDNVMVVMVMSMVTWMGWDGVGWSWVAVTTSQV